MNLSEIIKNKQFKGITCNSKEVSSGYLFIAIKGTRVNASAFIPEAVKRGALAIVAEDEPALQGLIKEYKGRLDFIKVKDARHAAALLAAEFYSRPSASMHVAGITGTNGKTTASYLIEAIVKESGGSPGVIGTVNYRFKGKATPALNTTPGPVELQALLAEMRKGGVTHVAMEVSSHALDQERVGEIDFKSAVFTNLTQDHLDYHSTQEDYFLAKSRLFKGLKPSSFCIINIDDPFGRRLLSLTKAEKATYAIDAEADFSAEGIKFDMQHTQFILRSGSGNTPLKSRLIGRHNVYNTLAAAAWGIKAGIPLEAVKKAMEKFSSVPGRLERIDSRAGFFVFVDYAHTEDALKNVLTTLRELKPKRIITLFGCGGERDKGKRPKMGRVVSELSDYSVVTSDNPRSEDPRQIIKEIIKGIKKDNYCVIEDRKSAVQKAISLAEAGDIVLLAGKGHEDYQVLKSGRVHFDDREVARECLASLKY